MGVRVWLAAVAAFLAVAAVAWCRSTPPSPRRSSAPAGEFSAERAAAALERILGDGTPHPTATSRNRAVRDRVLAELRALGVAPEIHSDYQCGGRAFCTQVDNILARIGPPGPAGSAILVTAHYDSVPAGPGASDDGAGVAAVIEIARALLSDSSPREHAIILLISDGEELGLLGAHAFSRHPVSAEPGVVVNVEARGTSGPSFLFETGPANAWIIERYARAAARPTTSSGHYTVYRLLPNDTDFSVYRDLGADGANFAFIGALPRYHTARDSLAHLDRGSLQHQGQSALALIRELAAEPWTAPLPRGEAIYFDVLSWFVVSWPSAAAPWVALLAAGLVIAAAIRLWRRRDLSLLGAAIGFGAFLLSLVIAALAGLAIERALSSLTDHPSPWWAAPYRFVAVYWALALAVWTLIGRVVGARAGAWGMWVGTWVGWSAVGVGLALALPGFSHLFVVPAAAAGLAGLVHARRVQVAALVCAVVAWVMWLPIVAGLIAALGVIASPIVSVPAAICLSPLAPLCTAPRRLLVAPAALLAGALVVALAAPRATPELPQGLNLIAYQDADSPTAHVFAYAAPVDLRLRSAPLPPALALRMDDGADRRPFPWFWPARAGAVIAPLREQPPSIEVVARAGGEVTVRARSPRGAWALRVSIPDSARFVSATLPDGRQIPIRGGDSDNGWHTLTFLDPPAEGIDVSLHGAGEVWVIDTSFGLPEAARAVADARPDSAVPFQTGDQTALGRRVSLR